MGDVPGDAPSGAAEASLTLARREVPKSGTLWSDFHTFTAFPWWPNAVLCNKWKRLLIHFSYYLEEAPHFPSARAHVHEHLVRLQILSASGREGGKCLLLASDWLVEVLELWQKDERNKPGCAKIIFLIGNWNFSRSAAHLFPAPTQFVCLLLNISLVPSSSSSSSQPPTHHLLHLQAKKKLQM